MTPARISLCLLPTPLHRLDFASEALGIDLWIKRDDLTGFALGGNKGRKLEFLVADALAAGCDTVVTCGSRQSNFIRQLGAACSMHGLKCVAAVMDLPFEHAPAVGKHLTEDGGNVLLDQLFGVNLFPFEDGPWETLYDHAERLALELESGGAKVYRIPVGGSSALGAYGFYLAGQEVKAQTEPFDWIVTATSSGSTQTGLAYSFVGTSTRVIGISSDPEPELVDDFAKIGEGLARQLNSEMVLAPQDFELNCDFVGPGYGVPSCEGDAAADWLAKTEGILLDPVYSAKAFAALLQEVRCKRLQGRGLFWHTGGIPTIFARK